MDERPNATVSESMVDERPNATVSESMVDERPNATTPDSQPLSEEQVSLLLSPPTCKPVHQPL